jgi:hypothetical protein
MTDPLSLSISVLALAVSAVTAWLTLFHLGRVEMTKPTVLFFGFDRPRSSREKPLPKIYLRALLFSTSKKGRIIENMYVSLSRNETHQNFSIWVYGNEKLVRGSGLFVGENGISANHHFLTPNDESSFKFHAGTYKVEVIAHLLGDKNKKVLFSHLFEISSEQAKLIESSDAGIYFDWGPGADSYISFVDERPSTSNIDSLLEDILIPKKK